MLQGYGQDAILITRGGFRTDSADRDSLRFAFGSCHDTTKFDHARWQAIRAERELDMLLLVGDQIYERGLQEPWFDSYADRYRLT